MRLPRTLYVRTRTVIPALGVLGAAVPAGADSCFEAAYHARLETDGIHLQISLSSAGWQPICWTSRPAAVDIYRRTLGGECGTTVRITEEPIPWVELAPGFVSVNAQIVDTGTTLGKGYRYTAQAVDAERNPVAENAEVPVGEVTRGVSLLGHGTLVDQYDGAYLSIRSLNSCPEECSSYGMVIDSPPSVDPYWNSSTQLAIYGEVLGQQRLYYNVLDTTLRIESAREQLCLVGVQPTTWSEAKRLYR